MPLYFTEHEISVKQGHVPQLIPYYIFVLSHAHARARTHVHAYIYIHKYIYIHIIGRSEVCIAKKQADEERYQNNLGRDDEKRENFKIAKVMASTNQDVRIEVYQERLWLFSF